MAKKRKPAPRKKAARRSTREHHHGRGDRESLRGVNRKLDKIITQNKGLSVTVEGLKNSVKALDAETTSLATRIEAHQTAQDAAIQALKDQLAAGGTITEADLDGVGVDLSAEVDRLKGLAKDPEAPVPATPLPPVEG